MKPISLRTDIASRKVYPQDELLRLVVKDGTIAADREGNLKGRGFYIRPDGKSLETAIKTKAFQRILHRPLNEEETLLIKEAICNPR